MTDRRLLTIWISQDSGERAVRKPDGIRPLLSTSDIATQHFIQVGNAESCLSIIALGLGGTGFD